MKNICTVFLLIFAATALFAQEDEWNTVNDGINNRLLYCIVEDPSDPDILYAGGEDGCYRSENHGERWQNICQGLPVRSIWVSENGNEVLIARSGGSRSDGIWRSVNGGDFQVYNWMLWPYTIAVNPENNRQVFGGTRDWGVYYTLNGGGDWVRGNEGLPDAAVNHLIFKEHDNSTYVFASTARGLYRCELGNNIRWEEAGAHGLPASECAFRAGEEDWIYYGTDDVSDSDGLWHSTNFGGEWEAGRWCHHVKTVKTIPGWVVFASNEIGVQRSEHDMENWTVMNEGLDEDDFDFTDLLVQDLDGELHFFCTMAGDGVYHYYTAAGDRPPSDFSLLEPENEAAMHTDEISFRWEESEDPDGDEVTYQFFMNLDGELFEAETGDTEFAINQGELQVEIPEDVEIEWWAVASAGGQETECEEHFTFTYRQDSPPSPFALVEPENGAVLESNIVAFRWERSVDPDEGDAIEYHFSIDLIDSVFTLTLPDTGFSTDEINTVIEFPEDEELAWWVVAQSNELQTECEERFTFMYSPDHPPEAFNLLLPENGADIETPDLHFEWEITEDPDEGDHVVYTWWFGIEEDSVSFSDIEENHFEVMVDSLGLNTARDYTAEWWVLACSNDYAVECEERFTYDFRFFSVDDNSTEIPCDLELYPAYPNPFNSSINVRFYLNAPAEVALDLIDVRGNIVKELIGGELIAAGNHTIPVDGLNLPVGEYLLRLQSDRESQIRKIVLVK